MNNIKQKLYSKMDEDRNELFEILSKLIKVNTENFSSYGNEEKGAYFLKELFLELGCETEVYSPLSIKNFEEHKEYFPGRNLENRLNCTGKCKGRNSERSLMLAAHIDTVEIGDESNWKFPPLCGDIKDGKILGRGACDDKYGLAAMIFILKKMKELGIELDYDLYLTGYCDEEYGGSHGALAACLKYKCTDYLNLDGRENEIWERGIGGGMLKFCIDTKSTVNNCSQVLAGINVAVRELEKFKIRRMEEVGKTPTFEGSTVVENALRIMGVSVGGSSGTDMGSGVIYITYYTNKNESYINNELEAIKNAVSKEFEDLGLKSLEVIKITRFFHYVEGIDNNQIVDLIKKCGAENGLKLKTVGACLSDLPMFQLYGSPGSISFGMGADFNREGGSHQANEYMECDKFLNYTKTLAGFMLEY